MINRSVIATILVAAALLGLSGCSASASATLKGPIEPPELRLGYFPNFTHAPAIVGVEKGFYQSELGTPTKLSTQTFNAGPAALEALLSGSIDAAFMGPSPTITGFVQSKGEALQVVAGAAANGAFLVVRKGITSVADLKGKTLATPQLGNTQDVALRFWLKRQGYKTTTEGGGDVTIQPQSNGTALQAFVQGNIDGAWEPEPYASQMMAKGNGHVLVDESQIWPNHKFVVTNLVVSKSYLSRYPDAVSRLLKGLLKSLDYIDKDPSESKTLVNTSLKDLTGTAIPVQELDRAWSNVEFTSDPIASSLIEGAQHAQAVGLLASANLSGLYDLKPLNKLLAESGSKEVAGP
ncbi:ABC transporter substrate-binding protein [Leifsonia sp. Root112D2]|uniref:ABC transporter substrate-binding protein n=1 Tax=Leifsonia sp. Root112D2 TaxID=1736426 RepID=UPI0006F1D421|nr:ABC transporter substrate-binding protein [Leifsonia sp. Root112D2]KQV07010.1 sulfonate ABC transporter substrate-binding protein [Leifsonia sp. Root112D2]